MAAHRLNDCYNSCEINYGNRLQQTKKNITEYEQSHKNGYSIEEIETYNNLQKEFDDISTQYNSCRTDCKNQTAGRSRSTIRRRNKSKTKRRQTHSTRRRNNRRRRSTRRNRKQ
jgi:hypothetical protein